MSDTTQQLKNDIDTGKTGDKIDQGYDPGLAPLGTDDEAAGTPNTPQQVRLARALERGDAASQPGEQGQRNPKRTLPAVMVVIGALLVVILAVIVALYVR